MRGSRPEGRSWMRYVAAGCIALALSTAALCETEPSRAPRLDASFGKLPLYFVENGGQLDSRVAYAVQGGDTSAYFTSKGVTLSLTT